MQPQDEVVAAGEVRDAVLRDVVEHAVGVEGGLEQHRRAGRQPGHDRVVAEDPGQRQRAEHHVALDEPEHGGVGGGVGQDGPCGVRGELRQAGGAGRRERDGERVRVRRRGVGAVVAPRGPGAGADVAGLRLGGRSARAGDDGDLGHHTGALDGGAEAVEQVEPVEPLGQGDEPRPCALEQVGDLVEAVAGVDADDVRLARRDGGLPDQRVAPVRHPHRDGVAAPDPVLAQLLGERAGPPPELAAAHGVGRAVGRRVEHGGDLGVATGEAAEEVTEVGGHLAGGGERGHGVRHGGGRHGHSLGAGPRRVPGDHGHLVHPAGASDVDEVPLISGRGGPAHDEGPHPRGDAALRVIS